MFSKNTLFIVGAGAGADINMPVGTQLADRISNASRVARTVSGDWLAEGDALLLRDAVEQRFPNDHEREERLRALSTISDRLHMSNSIDRFINENKHNPFVGEMGKVLIVDQILRAEKSSLWTKIADVSTGLIDVGHPFSRESWCYLLGNLWLRDIPTAEPERASENISIICFNYDRCLELYLTSFLAAKCAIPPAEARAIVDRIEIVHPYGTLGYLGLGEDRDSKRDGVTQFGAAADFRSLWSLADGLRTFSEEETRQHQAGTAMGAAIERAEQMIFLGFSYEDLNMRLLNRAARTSMERVATDREAVRVFGTTYRLPSPQVAMVRGRLPYRMGISRDPEAVTLADATCRRFFETFGETWI